MREIPIKKWNTTHPMKEELIKLIQNEAVDVSEKTTVAELLNKLPVAEESLVTMLEAAVNSAKPDSIPSGIDNFRLMGKITKDFDRAEKSFKSGEGLLKMEDFQYNFIKKLVESDIPYIWGRNINYLEAIESFLNAKSK